jgi:glycosyltransferase involved in cell wall biosynthesis
MQRPTDSPLRVGFNAALLSPSGDYRAAGMHRYIAGLLGALAEVKGLAVTAYVPRAEAELGPAYGLPPGLDLRPAPAQVRRPLGRILWEQTALPARMAQDGLDLIHGPAHALPALGRLPAVVTAHDLSFFRMPETLPAAKAFYLRTAMRHAARRASALVAISEFTKRELVSLLGLDPDRVQVIHNGVDPAFRPLPPAEVEAWRRASGLPESYILALGTLQPRKNLSTLLEAYAGLQAQMGGKAPDLVIAGASGWGPSDLGRRATELGIAERVRFPGFVPEADLPRLYNAATLLAYPSRYEGFGLPIAEAMACGTPCIVADASCLPEVAGSAAVAVHPDDAPGWAREMADLLEQPAHAAKLRTAGLARAARFTWTKAAEETADLYRRAAQSGFGRRSRPGRIGPAASKEQNRVHSEAMQIHA